MSNDDMYEPRKNERGREPSGCHHKGSTLRLLFANIGPNPQHPMQRPRHDDCNSCFFADMRARGRAGDLNNRISSGSDIRLRMLNWSSMMTEAACLNEPLSEEEIGPRTAGQW